MLELRSAVRIGRLLELQAACRPSGIIPFGDPSAAALDEPPAARPRTHFEAGSGPHEAAAARRIFSLALRACRDRGQVRLAFGALGGAGLLYAGHKRVVDFSGQEQGLWYEKTSNFGTFTATFVNRNSFATAYTGFILAVTTGLLLASLEGEGGTERGLRAWLHGLLSALLERVRLLIPAWVTSASALLLTQSRHGFFARSAGLCLLLAALALRRGSRPGLGLRAAAPILAGGIDLFSPGGEATDTYLAGIEGDAAERGRLQVIAERPFTGRCHGSFADAFRMMRNVEARQDVVITHNSDLELALEIEVPPAVLLVLVFAALFLRCVTSVRVRGRDVVVGVVQS